ncbi:hypothetical protein FLL45_11325 [Aliikangiella marina]|uniref:Hydrazine synthase alpha subunit middle domain-containing protein n=1 Tax=Aliikangiella marina TaxID=1712262 RepID=A0A545TE47_9GAMM|nr:PD40 domain-containing protein [Aliikangiella marina]TQV75498.1 hypothetical protein FLL45_11325 [Aliikangiella marina]
MSKNSTRCLLTTLLAALVAGCTGSEGVSPPEPQDPDPVVVDFPIAYVKRPIPTELDDDDNPVPVNFSVREPVTFNPGAALFVRDRAALSAFEVNVTDAAFWVDGQPPAEGDPAPMYDVKDVDVSFDGSKIVFAMRAPEIEGADEEDQPTWNIWEYDSTTQSLRRVIQSDITAEAGQDVMPSYLPDGSIVFSSTRQRQAKAVLLDEGKPQFTAFDEDGNTEALSLHVMSEDGLEIRQITFNQSHDMEPTVMASGKIVFSRWDNAPGNDTINLYQINPDGTGLEILYGRHSHDTGTDGATIEFVGARQVQDGRLLVGLKENTSTKLGGEFAFIDTENFIDINQPTTTGTEAGPAQVSATPFDVRTDDLPALGGRFSGVFPLYDGTGRMLISWTPCRLEELDANDNPIAVECTAEKLADPAVVEAPPLYGLWMYNPSDGSQLPIVIGEENIVTHEVVALAPRDLAAVIPDSAPLADQTLVEENVGIVHIRSIYDFDGQDLSPLGITAMADPLQTTADDRPVRFLRVVKPVSMPDEDFLDIDNTAFGRSRANGMRDILGYAVVHPDGSAMFKVPADVAFQINFLDANGRRIGARHQNWMSVTAGEVKQCNGCHERTSLLPHGRLEAQAQSINLGAPVTGSPFPNTNPALFADEGETMAEVFNRINGFQDLSVNVRFDDVWTDPNTRALDAPINFDMGELATPAPTAVGCLTNWDGRCRITINYVDHIQPMWELPRQVFDIDGNLLQDNTCNTCHGQTDDMGQLQVPAAQLELAGTPSADEPDQLTSYRELFFNDNALELMNGALIDQLVPLLDANGNPVYVTDADGNLVLDPNGDPIPVMVTVNVTPSMNVNSANGNVRFFSRFDAGGSHEGWLTDAEKKVLAEWLDIGGQYYNNPFDVPQ